MCRKCLDLQNQEGFVESVELHDVLQRLCVFTAGSLTHDDPLWWWAFREQGPAQETRCALEGAIGALFLSRYLIPSKGQFLPPCTPTMIIVPRGR